MNWKDGGTSARITHVMTFFLGYFFVKSLSWYWGCVGGDVVVGGRICRRGRTFGKDDAGNSYLESKLEGEAEFRTVLGCLKGSEASIPGLSMLSIEWVSVLHPQSNLSHPLQSTSSTSKELSSSAAHFSFRDRKIRFYVDFSDQHS